MKLSEDKIIEVAYRLFKRRGVRSINMQNVAHGCGIGHQDIISIFSSKEELVLSVVKHTLNKKTSYMLINSSLSPSAVTELKNFFKVIDETIADLGADILTELRQYQPLTLDQIWELVDNKIIPNLQRIIERGLGEGFYRDDLDHELYVTTYIYFLHLVLENDNHNWEETLRIIHHVNDIFFHGVLNVKGMRI
jgi:AcrR family transcriptional regulator